MSPATALRVATRRSPLAMAQTGEVARRITERTGRPVQLVPVTTRGDVDRSSLERIGGAGVFIAEVRRAVLTGEADVAVHSLKDLPTAADPALHLAAVPPREDPRDALVSRHPGGLAGLPAGARLGTGSPRRRAQVRALRPDLAVVDLRGNVETRIGRVHDSADLDAVLLAAAGLARLGRSDVVAELLEVDAMVPAPGQGALAVEVRAGDTALRAQLRALDDPTTRAAVTAERAVLAALASGCSAPVGAHGRVSGGTLHLRAVRARADGTLLHATTTGPVDRADQVGRDLAGDLATDTDTRDRPRSARA